MQGQKWVYLGKVQKQFIELKHDVNSGMASLYLNTALLSSIEVNEDEEKFDFFIDDELCSVVIYKVGAGFKYRFISKRKSTSKSSRFRKVLVKSLALRSYFILFIIFGVIVLAPITVYLIKKNNLSTELQKHGAPTLGYISPPPIGADFMNNTFYSYEVEGQLYNSAIDLWVTDRGIVVGPLGMPIELGDQFEVLYSRKNHDRSKILLKRPSDGLIDKYLQRAKAIVFKELLASRALTDRQAFVDCIVDFVYEKEGVEGLAELYFMNTSYFSNSRTNTSSFNEMMNKPNIKTRLDECTNRWIN